MMDFIPCLFYWDKVRIEKVAVVEPLNCGYFIYSPIMILLTLCSHPYQSRQLSQLIRSSNQ